jgi:hypothetical protein
MTGVDAVAEVEGGSLAGERIALGGLRNSELADGLRRVDEVDFRVEKQSDRFRILGRGRERVDRGVAFRYANIMIVQWRKSYFPRPVPQLVDPSVASNQESRIDAIPLTAK